MMIDTGSSVLNAVLNVLLFILVSYPVLGAFIWVIEVIFYRFLFKNKKRSSKKSLWLKNLS